MSVLSDRLDFLDTSDGCSKAEALMRLPKDVRERRIKELFTSEEATSLLQEWGVWARKKQEPPAGDWGIWVLRAGRGFGKTKCGAGWVNDRAMADPLRWIALVARTPADARDYMIEGPSGILRTASMGIKPVYEVSKRRITWPNGTWATIYSDEEPDQLRGFSGDTAWLDEFAKFKNAQDVWDNLAFGMREMSSDRPRRLITTTPRPIPILKAIERLDQTITVVGSSYENANNLDPDWVKNTLGQYQGTRLGRQEIQAEIVDDIPGALWTREMLNAAQYVGDPALKIRAKAPPDLKRVVVGVDPSGASGDDEKANAIGIVAVGLGLDGTVYVLADNTCSLSPAGWGRRTIETLSMYDGDKIVAEKNFGGAMVEHVIRSIMPLAPIKMVTASRGKVTRAEPVAALYEQGKVKHVGANLDLLEDQLCGFTPEGYVGEGSPDRVDALVWAVTELVLARAKFDAQPIEIGAPTVW